MTTSVEQPKDIELIGKGIDIAKLEVIKKNLPATLPEEIKEPIEYDGEMVELRRKIRIFKNY